MAKEYSADFYRSRAWQACRTNYIKQRMLIDGGLCEVCKTEPGYIVHHVVPLTPANIGDVKITLAFDNLKFECKACHDHEDKHWFDRKNIHPPRAAFDAKGNPIDLRTGL